MKKTISWHNKIHNLLDKVNDFYTKVQSQIQSTNKKFIIVFIYFQFFINKL